MGKENKKESEEGMEDSKELKDDEEKGSENIQEEENLEEQSSEGTKEEIKKENKQLGTLLLVIGGILIIFLLVYFFINSLGDFRYEGLDFKIIKEGELVFYNTVFPVLDSITGNFLGGYNFYIRNDPRKLDKDVAFEGEIDLKKKIVLNSESDFHCDGDGIIAVANFANLLKQAGAEVIKDDNATCDEQGRYTYILLKESNVTKIEQIGNSCYNIHINDCEILEGTERFMVEIFVKMNEFVNKKE